MEQKLPIIAKKFGKIVRVAYFMLRKGISKAKLVSELNIMMKRDKIAGKAAIYNFIHHRHGGAAAAAAEEPQLSYPVPLDEYEFTCRKSTAFSAFRLPFHLNKRKNHHSRPPPINEDELFAAAVEIAASVAASPALPGFGRSPAVRQLRVTDSPFPLMDSGDSRVDEAAEKFIMRFYSDLKRQNGMTS